MCLVQLQAQQLFRRGGVAAEVRAGVVVPEVVVAAVTVVRGTAAQVLTELLIRVAAVAAVQTQSHSKVTVTLAARVL